MKKGFKAYFTCWLVLFVLFNAICFVTPAKVWLSAKTAETVNAVVDVLPDGPVVLNKFGGAFWAGYIGIFAAFLGNLFCTKYAFQAENAEKFFLKVPLVRLSYVALIVTIVFGVAAMAIVDLPFWVGGAVCLAILALYAIAVVKADAAGELVAERGREVRQKTAFIYGLRAEAEALQSLAGVPEVKKACTKIYEAVRYSDPVSDARLEEEEEDIAAQFGEFSQAVKENNAEAVQSSSAELLRLMALRNEKAKNMK